MSHSPEELKLPLGGARKPWRLGAVAAIVLVVLAGGYAAFHKKAVVGKSGTLFAARKGPLEITVLAGGEVKALDSQVVKSAVHGETKILSIVPEGYAVTPEDVKDEKLLVELDSKPLIDRQVTQELEFQNAEADVTQARKEFDIQVNQNLSDITTAALAAKFAYMDFEKYMGVDAAAQILSQLDLQKSDLEKIVQDVQAEVDADNKRCLEAVAEASARAASDTPIAPPSNGNGNNHGDASGASKDLPPDEESQIPELKSHAGIDFTKYVDQVMQGDGEARQRLRRLEDAYVMAKKDLSLQQTLFDGTQRLEAKGFVTKTDLEVEKLKTENKDISLKAGETDKALFVKYEFPKTAEKYLSDYEEAVRRVLRAKQLAQSKLAQVAARRNSAEVRYKVQQRRRTEIGEQIEKCRIVAKVPGLVVYAGDENNFRGNDVIQAGATVREQQEIITIPDMSQMAVKIKVPEASVKSIVKGQKARIKIDAFPDQALVGEVAKVAVLPDAGNRWMNPDVKVYETSINIINTPDWLKPGMSAQVEVIVRQLPEVVFVPIQAVTPKDGNRVVYVSHLAGQEQRVVQVGEFNEQFIEIKSGLNEGEQVLLRAPVSPESMGKTGTRKDDGDASKDKDKNRSQDGKGSDSTAKRDTDKQNPQTSSATQVTPASQDAHTPKTETGKAEPAKIEPAKQSSENGTNDKPANRPT